MNLFCSTLMLLLNSAFINITPNYKFVGFWCALCLVGWLVVLGVVFHLVGESFLFVCFLTFIVGTIRNSY